MLKTLGLAILLAVCCSLGAQPASGKPRCLRFNSEGSCILWASDETDPTPTAEPAKGGSEPDEPGTPRKCTFLGQPTPCVTGAGVWDETKQCHVRPLDPQPPFGDPEWHGHTDGKIYGCYPPNSKNSKIGYFWRADPPDGIDPEPLAHQAMETMRLRAVRIGLSVPDLPDRMVYVGAPLWMWTADPDEHTLGPITATATAGDVTVTARAELDRIVWTMGDGTTVRCNGTHRARGTVYKSAFGIRKSPTCGHVYDHPAQKTTITATSQWTVTWSGAGQTGTIPLTLERSTTRAVGEIQVLIEQR